ncbi:alpha/beta hydrolase [Corynebacterium atypicum]|uniref:Alpha/beta hydrolase n=1 Tax=Corynebacterium atypicum TaxID=191610 RepID=A0ABN4DBI0_9CORY|nr:dienelactone hydrolase family protein [Corynebacterium atypicum]AIG63709.1 alpha/beta hydrolase [Corynebacterium atypicum]
MAENLKKHLSKLSKRGPNRVLVGDLSYAGLPGKVYTPATGNAVPGVAFGHDWLRGLKNYHATLRHLASWGIAVAAPETETGISPNHRGFAADLETAAQILAGVKLGQGNVTVGPGKLGMVGHGMGGGCAILAASNSAKVQAVAAIYPAATAPSCVEAAKRVQVPGLILGSGQSSLLDAGNPAQVAQEWGGTACYRQINKGNQQGFTEDTLFKLLIGAARPQVGAREVARGLLTGFLLATLDHDSALSGFASPTATGSGFESLAGEDLLEVVGDTGVPKESGIERSPAN